MPVSYTFEKDILWFNVAHDSPSDRVVKNLVRVFRDRRFVPGKTGILFDTTSFDESKVYPNQDKRKIVQVQASGGVDRAVIIVGDPNRCKAAAKYRGYYAECGIPFGVFCRIEDGIKFLYGNGNIPQCVYPTCESRVSSKGCRCIRDFEKRAHPLDSGKMSIDSGRETELESIQGR